MSRLLAIDAGNTRIKWGIHDGAAWCATGSVATREPHGLASVLAAHGGVARAIASNVAGEAVDQELARVAEALGARLRRVQPQAREAGVVNGYRDAGQLGPDRWAALVAARASGAGPQVVATAGTALTVDALSAAGEFLGGLIVPGPALMRRALESATARLRETEGRDADYPASTPDAITSGAIQACVGAIAGMVERLARREGARPHVLLSGGAAREISARLALPHAIRDNLVLDGLVELDRHG
ncbi:MAG TPA: type III pantothenate kinase [Usitatibacter sp.]|jgi:type III pantothenate kinase|nr:type III pantothenate kinase [Usitatibacter sp.]